VVPERWQPVTRIGVGGAIGIARVTQPSGGKRARGGGWHWLV